MIINKKKTSNKSLGYCNKSVESKTDMKIKTCLKNKEKRIAQNKKKHHFKPTVLCDEETSSTTTESSSVSNNEECEKIGDLRNPNLFSLNKRSVKNCISENLESLDKQTEKTISHIPGETKTHFIENLEDCLIKSRKQHKNSKSLKEKRNVLNKKNNRQTNIFAVGDNTLYQGTASESNPPVTPNIWAENRTKFSDVVASNTRLQHLKHTEFIEPYKQAAGFGPIGSEKYNFLSNDSLQSAHENQYHQISDSSLNITKECCNSSVYTGFSENGEQFTTTGTSSLNFISSNFFQTRNNQLLPQEYWNCSQPTSLFSWEDCGTHSRENARMASTGESNSEYWWPSSSVWQPVSSEVPRTSTRIPPGFIHTRVDQESPQQSDNLVYSTIGINDIWTQQHTHSWNSNSNDY